MHSLDDFKRFCGFYVGQVPAEKATGLLLLVRTDQADETVVNLPTGTKFMAKGLAFESSQAEDLNESLKQITLPVQSVLGGVAGNLPAGQNWTSSLSGLDISNPSAFQGGVDAKAEVLGSNAQKLRSFDVPDSVLQMCLDTSIGVIKGMCGLEQTSDLPVASQIDYAVLLVAKLFLNFKDVLFSQSEGNIDVGEMNFEEKRGYVENLNKAVYMEVLGILSPYRDVSKFITQVPA